MLYQCFKAPGMEAKVSKIVLGTANFGTRQDQKLSFELMDYYLNAGGNCLDTARRYGYGESEKMIGRWLKERGNRHEIFISSKGAHPVGENKYISRLSRADIDLDLEQSLTDLGTDYIDLYFLHRDEVSRPVSDIMETLDRHVKSGKVRAIGASNWSVERIEEANRFALENGLTPFSASQIQWSLATATPKQLGDDTLQTMTPDAYQWYLKEQMPVFSFSSQAFGFFTLYSAYGTDRPVQPKEHRWGKMLTEENRHRTLNIQKLSRETGASISALVLAYLTSNPVITYPIIGCGSMNTLRDSLAQPDVTLTQEQIRFLETGE